MAFRKQLKLLEYECMQMNGWRGRKKDKKKIKKKKMKRATQRNKVPLKLK